MLNVLTESSLCKKLKFGTIISVVDRYNIMFLMRNQVYSRYLYQMLMEFGKVSVPTLGTFALQYTEASFKNNKSILSAPSTKVVFTKEVTPNCYLSDLLLESGMQEDDSKLVQNLLVQDYSQTEENLIPFELDGFGTFVNNIFLPKDGKFYDKYLGLGELSVKALPTGFKKVIHDDEYTYRLNTPFKTEKSSFLDQYLLPILSGLLVLAFILWWLLTPKTSITTPANNDHMPVVNDTVAYEEIITDADISYVDSTNQITDSLVSTTESVIVESKEVPKPAKKGQEVHKSKHCVVIVGAFKDSANADKLIKNITAKGYKTYSSHHQGLRRVGISYDCTKIESENFKIEIKKKFNKDAWHLHDTL